jgi:hypothetical protein
MDSFIIEHPTRGTLKFFVSESEYGFSTTGSRADPNQTMQFHSLNEAARIHGKLPDRVRKDCKILQWVNPGPRQYGKYEEVAI